jgi:hypothetical protein
VLACPTTAGTAAVLAHLRTLAAAFDAPKFDLEWRINTLRKWIELDKEQTDRYAYNHAYIQLLVEKLQRGEYDPDDLNDTERAQVAEYLKNPPTDA